MRSFGRLYRVSKAHDRRGAGGNIAWGIRRVRKGGRVRFDRYSYQHDDLIPLVGSDVEVTDAEDIWYSSQIRIQNLRGGLICYAKNESEMAA